MKKLFLSCVVAGILASCTTKTTESKKPLQIIETGGIVHCVVPTAHAPGDTVVIYYSSKYGPSYNVTTKVEGTKQAGIYGTYYKAIIK